MFRFAVLVAALVALLVVAAPVGAKEKLKPDDIVVTSASGEGIAPGAPDAVRERVKKLLEGRSRGYVPGIDSPASLLGPQAVARANWIGCRTQWARRSAGSVLGYNYWHYYQQLSWCSNGFSIYSWSRERWPDINFPGWAFGGHIGGSLGGTHYRKEARTQGSFHYCAGFCNYIYPWVYQAVTADGDHYYNTGD